MSSKNLFFKMATAMLLLSRCAFVCAQVTIGADKVPDNFSVLELVSNDHNGLRLPQIETTAKRDLISADHGEEPEMMGLTIFNMETKCVDTWNGTMWISECFAPIPPISVTITPTEAVIPVFTVTPLTADVEPANATDIRYKWEYSYDGSTDWQVVDDGTSAVFNAEALRTGDTYYRVTAYNDAGSATSNSARITGTMPEGSGTNPNVQMYVGAFWRANEKGERVIQFGVGTGLNNSGAWNAAVIWYDNQWDAYNAADPDGVELAINSSPLNLPLSDMNAENHPVTDGSQFISGTVAEGGTISFRIGLNKYFTSFNANNDPARYAVVMLTYNNGNKWYKLFIRQGEGADYVMRPGDNGINVPAGRQRAVKFMPYNVTDPSKSTPTNWGNAISLTPATSQFTNFPTKAGYFFMEEDTKAFAPDIPPSSLGAWTRNRGTKVTGGFWSPTLESCPSGYRRPSDGADDTHAFGNGSVADSEIRQSLWTNPPSGINSNNDNSSWGYYADGYFDRNKIVSSLTNPVGVSTATPNSAVNTNSVDVAYEGRLFFNPTTNASLFFPGGGFRFDFEGSLYNAGGRARYWTSTSYSLTNQQGSAWFLFLDTNTDDTITAMYYDSESSNTVTPPVNNSKTAGALMRCVK